MVLFMNKRSANRRSLRRYRDFVPNIGYGNQHDILLTATQAMR